MSIISAAYVAYACTQIYVYAVIGINLQFKSICKLQIVLQTISLKGGTTIVIGGDNVPPNTHECGGQGGTKLLGDPILHMHKMSSSVENHTIKNENYQQMRIACLPTTTIRKATAYFLSTLYIQLSFINCHNVARVAVSSQSQ